MTDGSANPELPAERPQDTHEPSAGAAPRVAGPVLRALLPAGLDPGDAVQAHQA